MRLIGVLVMFEKYGTLSIYEQPQVLKTQLYLVQNSGLESKECDFYSTKILVKF